MKKAKRKCRAIGVAGCENGENFLEVVAARDKFMTRAAYLEQDLKELRKKEAVRKERAKQRKQTRSAFKAGAIRKLIGEDENRNFDDVVAEFVRRVEYSIGFLPGDPGKMYPLAERVERVMKALQG